MHFHRLLLAFVLCGALTAETTVAVHGTRLIVSAPTYQSSPEVVARLAQKVSVEFVDTPFEDAVEFLRVNCGVNFVIGNDIRTLSPVVTLKLTEVSLGQVLKWMRVTTKVDWHVLDQAVFFSNEPIAGEQMVKIYDVADVVYGAPSFRGPEITVGTGGVDIGGVGDEVAESPYTAEDLAEIIRTQVLAE